MEANSSSPMPARTMSAAIGPRNGPAGDPRWRERALNILLPFIAVIAFLVLWSAGVRVFEIPDYLLPTPEDVIRRVARDWYVLARNASYTMQSVLSGFAAAVLVGVPLAFAVVLSRSVERVTMPFLVMSQTIPKVAIAPILVVWLGFGILPKIAIVFLIAFFPIVVSTVVGLKSVESDMVDLVRSMGARTLKIMLRVRGPTALPQMFAGFKIAICLSVVGAVVGEFVGIGQGARLPAADRHWDARRDVGVVRVVHTDRYWHRTVRDRVEARTLGDSLACFDPRRGDRRVSIVRPKEQAACRLYDDDFGQVFSRS
jgi:NitT/TauT family transport system permease protein